MSEGRPTLRPYQREGVQAIREAFKARLRAPLYVLPTGGGKTVIFSEVGHLSSSKGNRIWVLVHRIELLRQTSKALSRNGLDHGLINPKYTPEYTKAVQVASVQTLIKRLHHFSDMPPDLIIIDEAHHATAGSWRKIIEYFPKARVLGVTATPIRGDGQGLGEHAGGIFDDIIIGPQISELIKMGYLVQPRIFASRERLDFSDVKRTRGDYDKKEIEGRVDKQIITGNAVEHYAKICPGKPAVVFCVSVAHAEHVAAEFRGAGFKAYSVDGSMEDDIRNRILRGLGNGQVQVVTSCDLISEGTDIPAIACAILLRPTQSKGLYLQQVGRALRLSEGKDQAIILDHVGNVMVHGLPDDEQEWTLDGEVKNKREKGETGPMLMQCSECFTVHKKEPECPVCGFVYPPPEEKTPEQEDGELTELTPEDIQQIKWKQRREVSNAKTLEELVAIGKARGYKPGWARHMYTSRQQKQHSQG